MSKSKLSLVETIETKFQEQLSPEEQIEINKILENRVRLRCTGKDCELRDGFFTDKSFKNYYLNERNCILCGSKNAEQIKKV